MTEPQQSPLADRHTRLQARFAEFGGWQMPLQYSGVLTEHNAVRDQVGIFDVSHLGNIEVTGEGTAEYLNTTLTNDLNRIEPGRAQYTLCCEESGGVVDDLIVYLYGPDRAMLVPNAGNNATVAELLAASAPAGVTVRNVHADHAILAVQGPLSAQTLTDAGLPSGHRYMSFVEAELAGVPVTVCRTGYTGEHGYEVIAPADGAGPVWDALFRAVDRREGLPCGLGARDTLRTEMGYPLHGQDISRSISPVQARLGWAVGWAKPAFWGRDALVAERAAGPGRLLRGLESLDRSIPRQGMKVQLDGEALGEVTSGTYSPTKRVGIGLALLTTGVELADGAEVEVEVRNRPTRMRVVKPPFVSSHTV